MTELTDEAIDEIRHKVFIGTEAPELILTHRQFVRNAIKWTRDTLAAQTEEQIREMMARAIRAALAQEGIDINSSAAETKLAQTNRMFDEVVKLINLTLPDAPPE